MYVRVGAGGGAPPRQVAHCPPINSLVNCPASWLRAGPRLSARRDVK